LHNEVAAGQIHIEQLEILDRVGILKKSAQLRSGEPSGLVSTPSGAVGIFRLSKRRTS
jgi:hypothetical protein